LSGLFITLEGIDGSGKSTQVELLATSLRSQGVDLTLTREPGGTLIGQDIRAVLLSNDSVELVPQAEMLLMIADRAQDVAQIIRPALEAGRLVISDRYSDSSVAFQGYGRGLDLALIHDLNRYATGGLVPDLTILFDLDPPLAQGRLKSRYGEPGFGFGHDMTRFDDELLDFHTRVRDGYLKMAAAEPARIHIVDASGTLAQTHAKVMAEIQALFATQRG
jgi:dTMP kinase